MAENAYAHMDFEELRAVPEGTVLDDWQTGGVRALILRGPGSLCAYIGVPMDHLLAGQDPMKRDGTSPVEDVDVHGGWTFADAGDGTLRPAGWWWFGWDYNHWGDCSLYTTRYHGDDHGTGWTFPMVRAEVDEVLPRFIEVARKAEQAK